MRPLLSALALAAALGCQSAEGQKAAPVKPAQMPAAGGPLAPKPPSVPTDITARDYPMPTLPHGRVKLKDAYGGQQVVDVEVAATRDARTRGLMWRTELAGGKGMLFIFPAESVQGFWMRNTLIPLDMLFINAEGKVAGIVESAEPQTLTSRSVGKPSKFVLEVPGGWCAKQGVIAGSSVTFEGIEGVKVEN